MASLFDDTKGLDDIGEIYSRLEANCPNPASTSQRLWELRRATRISAHNPSEETMLEKAVAMLAARGHMDGWFNQCPTASGIGDSSRDKRRNVDLVHWSTPNRHARLVALKWGATIPLKQCSRSLAMVMRMSSAGCTGTSYRSDMVR